MTFALFWESFVRGDSLVSPSVSYSGIESWSDMSSSYENIGPSSFLLCSVSIAELPSISTAATSNVCSSCDSPSSSMAAVFLAVGFVHPQFAKLKGFGFIPQLHCCAQCSPFNPFGHLHLVQSSAFIRAANSVAGTPLLASSEVS